MFHSVNDRMTFLIRGWVVSVSYAVAPFTDGAGIIPITFALRILEHIYRKEAWLRRPILALYDVFLGFIERYVHLSIMQKNLYIFQKQPLSRHFAVTDN